MGLGDLVHRIRPVDDRAERAGFDELLHQHRVGLAPAATGHLLAAGAEEPAEEGNEDRLDRHRADVGGDVDAARFQRRAGAVEDVFADRVDDRVERPALPEVLELVVDDLVGAERPDERDVRRAADPGHVHAPVLRDLDSRRPEGAGRAVDHDPVTALDVRYSQRREGLRRAVVDRGSLLEGHPLGHQCDRRRLPDRDVLGVGPWSQATDGPALEAAAKRIDELGYDSLWCWDHIYAIFGDPYQPIFEGYTTLAAWAKVTSRVRLGLLVGANPLRHPAVVAKMLATIDHLSGGRAIAGMGGAWAEIEFTSSGIDFGSGFGQRLDWMEESVSALEDLFAGKSVTSAPGAHYAFDDFRLLPLPLQKRLPILIGGPGEKKTRRSIAKHADMWDGMGSVEFLAHKVEVLHRHCEAVGRDPAEIEMTAGCKPIIRNTAEEARRVWEAPLAQ